MSRFTEPAAALLLTLAACGPADLPTPPTASNAAWSGAWTVELTSPGGPLPFELVIDGESAPPAAIVHNGAERLECPTPTIDGDRLAIRFDRSSTLELIRADDGAITGAWTLFRSEALGTERMRADARLQTEPRFAAAAIGAATAARIAPRYRVEFESSDDDAIGLFDVREDGIATGTFLTTTGDYRFLAGSFDGRDLRLSCFDGAHAFLFHASRAPDGTLRGRFWSRGSWHETWVGTPDPDAALADGFDATSWRAEAAAGLAFPDLDGTPRRLDAPELRGRAQVIVVFGSWCPNCHDATRLWAALHRRYRDRGLAVVGLAFERTADLDRETSKLRTFVDRQGIDFPVLVAGLADKAAASETLPVLDRVRAYPTTIFRDAGGRAVAVHTGFTGPAAPAEHAALVARFEAIVDDLLTD